MIVLDTHVWIWWLHGNHPSFKASWQDAIADADEIGVAAISCFEVAWLFRKKRVEVTYPMDKWFDAALDGSGVRLLPMSAAVAQIAVELPEHHRDPFDRMIIATALVNGAGLLSADGRFSEYKALEGRLVQ